MGATWLHGRMRARLIIAAIFVVACALPAVAQSDLDGSFPADAGVEFEAMHQVISAEFTDPTSAQYKAMVKRDRLLNDFVVCGWVNAKNSMGGYTPFVPFSYNVKRASGATYEGILNPTLRDLAMTALASSGCSAAALGL